MTDHRDSYDGTEPDPDADRWSAWLPPLDATSDRTGAADPGPHVQRTASPRLRAPVCRRARGRRCRRARAPRCRRRPPRRSASYTSYRSARHRRTAAPRRWWPCPERHLGLAIFATFFGFTPLGIIAIVLALSVARLHRSGRIAEAERASRRARTWAIAALRAQAAVDGLLRVRPGVLSPAVPDQGGCRAGHRRAIGGVQGASRATGPVQSSSSPSGARTGASSTPSPTDRRAASRRAFADLHAELPRAGRRRERASWGGELRTRHVELGWRHGIRPALERTVGRDDPHAGGRGGDEG